MTETDISTFPDLDPLGGWIAGTAAIGQCVARRLLTPNGSLWYDPDFGLDLRELVNAGMTQAQASLVDGLVQAECEKDERILSADVAVTWVLARGALDIRISLETSAGPYAFTFAIDKVSSTLLAT